MARGLYPAARAARGTAFGEQRAVDPRGRLCGVHVGADDDLPAIALSGRGRAQGGGPIDADGGRLRKSLAALPAAADPDAAAAAAATGVDPGAGCDGQRLTRHGDRAADAGRGRRIDRSAHRHGARGIAGAQYDRAVAVFHRARPNDARGVDRARQEAVLRARGHVYRSAIRGQNAAVLGERGERALVHGDLQQLIARKGQCRRRAGAERHRAEAGADDALIADRVAEKCDVAAVRRRDRPLVEDAAGAAAAEGPGAATGRIRIEGRGDQTADVDLCALAKQDAVRVDEPHLAVRIQVAQDLAAAAAEDAVDRDGARVRLHEVHRLVGGDVEGLPIHTEGLAILMNSRCGAVLGDLRGTGGDLAAERCGWHEAGEALGAHGE